MTNFEKLGAVKQAAAEKLFHIIIEAHGAGSSPYEDPAFAECVAIVQGVEIASTVAHKFDAPPPSASAASPGQAYPKQTNEEHLEGKSFQINAHTVEEGERIDGQDS
jgi:hypothetical protein